MIKYLKPNETFVIQREVSDFYNEKGEALVAGVDYNLNHVVGATYTIEVLNPFTVKTTGTYDNRIKVGTLVTIVMADGIESDYVVKNIGNQVLRFTEQLEASAGDILSMKVKIGDITFLKEGIFNDSSNNTYFISQTFSSIYIDKKVIVQMYPSINKDEDIALLNEQAKNFVASDFSYNTNFHNILDMGQLTALITLKIGHILERRERGLTPSDMLFQKDYDELKKSLDILVYRDSKNLSSNITKQELEDEEVIELTYEVGV